jgi:hypothetical protein
MRKYGPTMKKYDIKQIYNTFENKDMPFIQFKKKINQLTDPVRMQRDLENIRMDVRGRKITANINKQIVDKALRNQNGH